GPGYMQNEVKGDDDGDQPRPDRRSGERAPDNGCPAAPSARGSDQVLHARTVEAWAYALGGSSRSGSAGPPYAIPPSAPAFAWVCRRRLRISLCAFRQGRASRAQPRLHDRASGQLHLLEHTFGGGQLKPETVAIDKRRYVTDRPL